MGARFSRTQSGGDGVSQVANYTSGFKARMVQRMAGPEGISATALAKEVGIAQATLSRWLRDGRTLGAMSKKKSKSASGSNRRTAEEKYRLVVAAEGLIGEALGAFLRREGVHESQLAEWREKATSALKDLNKKKNQASPESRRIRDLERELNRKEKALAEAAALLVLKKKLETYREERESRTDTRSET